MKNKHIIRYGTETGQMRSMVADDILISRLNLLIIMAKAYLKSYPMGEFRRKAIVENARFVFKEVYRRTRATRTASFQKTQPHSSQHHIRHSDQLFLLRTQLLAVMVNSFAGKRSRGSFRKKAMAENIELISEYLADGFQFGDTQILKVA
jgi:hypothetical protein